MKHICFFSVSPFAAAGAAALLALQPAAADVSLVSPSEGEVVPLLSEGQKAWLDRGRAERVASFADKGERAAMRKLGYVPLPVPLAWEWSAPADAPAVVAAARPRFTVEVRRLPDGVPVFRADCREPRAEVGNLEIARDYEWMVWADVLGRVEPPVSGRFRTEDHAPRLMACGAVPNVRDLGGRIGLGGRRVRQGLVYRSAGLNSNAGQEYYTREETLAMSDHPEELLAREKALQEKIDALRRFREKPAELRLLSADVSRTWTMFRMEVSKLLDGGESALRGLSGVPDEFLGAPAQTVSLDGEDKFALPAESVRGSVDAAVFVQVVESPEDGWISLGCGADWWWRLFVNGEVAFDCADKGTGNGNPAKSAEDHVFAVRVRKGPNVFTAAVCAGSEGLAWACRAAPAVPVARLLDSWIANCQSALDALFRVEKGLRPGESRIGDVNRETFLGRMGVRSDIDLRSDRECFGMEGSPLGPDVTWWHYSSSAYAGMASENGREAFSKVFRVFLDPANYPIDFHCIAGQDRTGAVAFILNALLGVEEEELWRDWESTGFWNPSVNFRHDRLFNHLVRVFDGYPGGTIRERVEAYVLSLGFTREDIGKLREILLED